MDKRLFNGFERDFLFLLSENSFNDSKAFYETVKEKIKRTATVPMRNLCCDLMERLFEIDNRMNLVPTKMVSRVRRDTRMAKSKNMYRENMWCMFMRDKYSYEITPCMWFEVTPSSWSCGVGIYKNTPTFMSYYRKTILENPKEFKKAIKSLEKAGAFVDAEFYKKDKEGTELVERSLQKLYNAKSNYFIYFSDDFEPIFDGSVEDILKEKIKLYAPYYKFVLKAYEKMLSEKGKNNE